MTADDPSVIIDDAYDLCGRIQPLTINALAAWLAKHNGPAVLEVRDGFCSVRTVFELSGNLNKDDIGAAAMNCKELMNGSAPASPPPPPPSLPPLPLPPPPPLALPLPPVLPRLPPLDLNAHRQWRTASGGVRCVATADCAGMTLIRELSNPPRVAPPPLRSLPLSDASRRLLFEAAALSCSRCHADPWAIQRRESTQRSNGASSKGSTHVTGITGAARFWLHRVDITTVTFRWERAPVGAPNSTPLMVLTSTRRTESAHSGDAAERFCGPEALAPLFELAPGERVLRVEQTVPPKPSSATSAARDAVVVRNGRVAAGVADVVVVRSPEDWSPATSLKTGQPLKPLTPKMAFGFKHTEVVEEVRGAVVFEVTCFLLADPEYCGGWVTDWNGAGGGDPYIHTVKEVVGADPDDSESAKFDLKKAVRPFLNRPVVSNPHHNLGAALVFKLDSGRTFRLRGPGNKEGCFHVPFAAPPPTMPTTKSKSKSTSTSTSTLLATTIPAMATPLATIPPLGIVLRGARVADVESGSLAEAGGCGRGCRILEVLAGASCASRCSLATAAPSADAPPAAPVASADDLRDALQRCATSAVNSGGGNSSGGGGGGGGGSRSGGDGGGRRKRQDVAAAPRGAVVVFGEKGYGSERAKRRVCKVAPHHDAHITGLIFDDHGVLCDVKVCEGGKNGIDYTTATIGAADEDAEDGDGGGGVICCRCGHHKAASLGEWYRARGRQSLSPATVKLLSSRRTTITSTPRRGYPTSSIHTPKHRPRISRSSSSRTESTLSPAPSRGMTTLDEQRRRREAARQRAAADVADHEACRWLLVGAECGSHMAARALGDMYAKGAGVRRSREEAERWFALAAHLRCDTSCEAEMVER